MSGRIRHVLREMRARWGERSYSQDGEDRILSRMLDSTARGFYVDVGAHHPHRYSNTYLFYRRGWRGINIDAMPGSMVGFARTRPRDINIECAVDEQEGVRDFYVFDEPAVCTLDADMAKRHAQRWRLLRVERVHAKPLSRLLASHLPPRQRVDFLSIDVEGRDLSVLRSNDWSAFRPRVVLVEMLDETLETLASSRCSLFMLSVGYRAVARTHTTTFFVDEPRGAP